MGPLLTALSRTALGALLGLSLTAVRCAPDCRSESEYLALSAPYSTYFSQLPAQPAISGDGRVVTARSSTGLTESYANLYVSGSLDFPLPEPRGCTFYTSEGRSLRYRPTLYRRTFVVSVTRYPEGPMLIVQEQHNSGMPATADSQLYYRLAEQRPDRVRYYDPAKYSYQDYDVLPDAQTLPSLTVAGRTYSDVLRLTNPYAAQQGPAVGATAYYISMQYGLVRFEQRDGTVWDLTP